MVQSKAPAITPIETSLGLLVPLNMDVSPFENSKSNKEGVSRTYKGCDGYAPIFAYLGREGYLVNLELREVFQHCQKDTPLFLKETLDYARKITSAPILMRLDSGNGSQDNFQDPERYKDTHFIIKRNLRKESLQAWLDLSKKNVWLGKITTGITGQELPYCTTFEVTER